MTATIMHTAPRRSSAETTQDGPVLLAAKPMGTLGAPFAAARWLAAREDRELRVVTVLEPHVAVADAAGIPLMPREYFEEERTTVALHLCHELQVRGTIRDVSQIEVLEGSSLEPIMTCAREHTARVVVIGSGRHDPLGRYVYGERALEILRIADRPVLVVPPRGIALSIRVGLVATDFSPASLRAARAMLPMLSHGGRLIIAHVKTEGTLGEKSAGHWRGNADARDRADHLAEFVRNVPSLPGITLESAFLRAADVASTLVDFAAALGVDLIACGRLGHSLMQRVFVGSVSSALVRHATCPLLVAPELPADTAAAR